MAQLATVAVPQGVWTQITNADATSITFQNQAGHPVLIKGTVNTTAPTTSTGAIHYPPFSGERNVTVVDLFPSPASVVRLWAYFTQGPGYVMVSHA